MNWFIKKGRYTGEAVKCMCCGEVIKGGDYIAFFCEYNKSKLRRMWFCRNCDRTRVAKAIRVYGKMGIRFSPSVLKETVVLD